MLDPIFQFVEKFVTDFSWKRLAIFFSIIVLFIFLFMLYEWHTATNELTRYERSVELLKDLELLAKSNNKEIAESSSTIISSIKNIIQKDDITSKLEISVSPKFAQVIFGILPWLLLYIILLPDYVTKGKKNIYNLTIGFCIFFVVIGLVAYSIPTDWSKWIRYGAVQLINIIAFLVMTYIGNKD